MRLKRGKIYKYFVQDCSSIRNEGVSTFWTQKITRKKSMKFLDIYAFYCLFNAEKL